MNYPIGTVCIGQNFTQDVIRNDMEGEVIEGLQYRECRNIHTGRIDTKARYKVRWADGVERWYVPYHLRRKQSDSQWADEAVRKLKKQSSDHVAGGSKHLIPEEAV